MNIEFIFDPGLKEVGRLLASDKKLTNEQIAEIKKSPIIDKNKPQP